MQLWLHPRPPEPTRDLVCAWPRFGLPETRRTIDTEVWDAASRAHLIWPDDAALPVANDEQSARGTSRRETGGVLKVYVDAADGMAGLGEVAVWSFEPELWGECTQAPTEDVALEKFRRRCGRADLVVEERITGPEQVFARDHRPASDDEIDATLRRLRNQRAATIDLILRADAAGALDVEDESVEQPSWMPWRTPRAIAQHLIADAAGAYLKRLALPVISPKGALIDDLIASGAHLQQVVQNLPRDRVTEYAGERWTSVKFLRRQAWHEGVEQVFLRRRLRAAGVLRAASADAPDEWSCPAARPDR
jgi:hypothetical protein